MVIVHRNDSVINSVSMWVEKWARDSKHRGYPADLAESSTDFVSIAFLSAQALLWTNFKNRGNHEKF